MHIPCLRCCCGICCWYDFAFPIWWMRELRLIYSAHLNKSVSIYHGICIWVSSSSLYYNNTWALLLFYTALTCKDGKKRERKRVKWINEMDISPCIAHMNNINEPWYVLLISSVFFYFIFQYFFSSVPLFALPLNVFFPSCWATDFPLNLLLIFTIDSNLPSAGSIHIYILQW